MDRSQDLDASRKRLLLVEAQLEDPAISETDAISAAGEVDILTEALIDVAASEMAEGYGEAPSFVTQNPELRARAAFNAGYQVGLLAAGQSTGHKPPLRVLPFNRTPEA